MSGAASGVQAPAPEALVPDAMPGGGIFGFLGSGSNEGTRKPNPDHDALSSMMNLITTALDKSDARVAQRLDEFAARLDRFEGKLQEYAKPPKGVVGAPPEVNTLALRARVERMSCASSDSLTMAERQKLADELTKQATEQAQQTHLTPAAAPAAAAETLAPGPAQERRVATSKSDHRSTTGGRRDATPASQRERFLAKFEKAEIFGKSVEEIEQEKLTASMRLRQKQGGSTIGRKCMLMPGSGIRLAWDSVSVLLVFYVALALPYQVAFLMDYMDAGISIMDFFIDCFFLADIFVRRLAPPPRRRAAAPKPDRSGAPPAALRARRPSLWLPSGAARRLLSPTLSTAQRLLSPAVPPRGIGLPSAVAPPPPSLLRWPTGSRPARWPGLTPPSRVLA